MNILIVTSNITYIPDNYLGLIQKLTNNFSNNIKGFVFIDNLDFKILKSLIGLYLIGANQTASSIAKNILKIFFDKRKKIIAQKSIPILNFKTMNDKKVIDWVVQNNIDVIINIRTRCIYKKEILRSPKMTCINVHHGILPKYRGTLCDLYALYENREAGFSIHQMDEKVDSGEIFEVIIVDNGTEQNYTNYLKKAALKEEDIISQFISNLIQSNSIPKGIENKSTKKIYTKNPDKKIVQAMKKKGMKV